jgi:hypothetical protein
MGEGDQDTGASPNHRRMLVTGLLIVRAFAAILAGAVGVHELLARP